MPNRGRAGIASIQELEASLHQFQAESDRACAVLGAAHLDQLLASAIVKTLPKGTEVAEPLVMGVNAALATFSSRIDIAYALGIIDPDARGDLDNIRRIRNKFAHDLHIHEFKSDAEIRSRCGNLKRRHAIAMKYSEPHRTNLLWPRNRYVMTVIDLVDDLRVAAGLQSERKERVIMSKDINRRRRTSA